MRPEVEKAIEEMMVDPKVKDILEALGSDYDENGIPYWEKDI